MASLELGRHLTQQFLENDLEQLWDRFTPALRHVFGSVSGLSDFARQVQTEAGRETEVISEGLTPWLGSVLYSRTARFDLANRRVLIQWAFDSAGYAHGLVVTPLEDPAPSRFLDYETRTHLRLPFAGEWFVFWGGRDITDNQHVAAPDQRFAYDFVIVRNGSTYSGSGAANADFHCFDAPVTAPADGVVVVALDAVDDNRPGTMNPHAATGNHVVIDHSNGEHSFIAHLRRGTLTVRAGDSVRAGDPIGRCGNSGNSSEPHVHYHLQNTPHSAGGDGLPAQFREYFANGRLIERGEPTRGQVVSRPQ